MKASSIPTSMLNKFLGAPVKLTFILLFKYVYVYFTLCKFVFSLHCVSLCLVYMMNVFSLHCKFVFSLHDERF